MLAGTAVWQGAFGTACELFTVTAELAAQRVGDDIGRYWCLTGKAEALLRIEGMQSGEIRRVLDAAQASTERRLREGARFGLQDGPTARRIQQMRLLVLSGRLHVREGAPDLARVTLDQVLELAKGLACVQPAMLECWSGLAELVWQTGREDRRADRQARTLERHLTRFIARNPGAAARLGWARALLRLARGDKRAADREARQALINAWRLDAHYDAEQARRLLAKGRPPGA
jgi:hypothetical protein